MTQNGATQHALPDPPAWAVKLVDDLESCGLFIVRDFKGQFEFATDNVRWEAAMLISASRNGLGAMADVLSNRRRLHAVTQAQCTPRSDQ